jgi:hypothetical protein
VEVITIIISQFSEIKMNTKKALCILSMFFLLIEHNIRAQDFITGNHINIQIRTVCTKTQANLFSYNYILTNKPTSEQRIWVFAIFTRIYRDSISKIISSSWDYGIPKNEPYASVRWTPSDDVDLLPDSSADGFGIIGKGLPCIVDAYAEGYHEPPSFPDGMATDIIPGYSDLTPYGPGVVGKTIGPVTVPNPFVPLNFLDTLSNYTTQSRLLGWIKDDATANKYLGYFSSAKTYLQQNNITSTRTTLQRVLQDVNVDSTSHITIEAYALIRYNTEYLLEKLPYEITVTELLDTLHSRLQQAYTSGWIGDQLLVQTLDRNIQNARSKYSAKDSIGCAQEIESFYKIVRLQYLATLKIRGKQFVTVEAYNLLYGFSKGIIEKVLTFPPRSLASLIDQVTALRAQIRIDASQGLLGGELLLKGLEFSLDAAKQRLQKKDSIGTALYVTLFQQTVRQTYELTKKLPKSKLYVKSGGYISLYYRAGYILEGLLDPIGHPMPKMDSTLEKELRKYEKEVVE